MPKFFEEPNTRCEHFSSGGEQRRCNHKKNTNDYRECAQGYCPLLIEAGLVTIEETKKKEKIESMWYQVKHGRIPEGFGPNQFNMIVQAMLISGYKISKGKMVLKK